MVYDSKGNLTETLVKSGANRLEASYEELPQCLIDAFIYRGFQVLVPQRR